MCIYVSSLERDVYLCNRYISGLERDVYFRFFWNFEIRAFLILVMAILWNL